MIPRSAVSVATHKYAPDAWMKLVPTATAKKNKQVAIRTMSALRLRSAVGPDDIGTMMS
jgi:hypothetical protein